MTEPIDDLLATLLATPERPADEHFVRHAEALVRFDQHRRAARHAAFTRVSREAAAGAAMLTAFVAAARIGTAAEVVPLFSPAMAGLIALGLWCAVSLRAPERASARG